eukprot:ANDGO_08552.mRNA.1 hypothetical protein
MPAEHRYTLKVLLTKMGGQPFCDEAGSEAPKYLGEISIHWTTLPVLEYDDLSRLNHHLVDRQTFSNLLHAEDLHLRLADRQDPPFHARKSSIYVCPISSVEPDEFGSLMSSNLRYRGIPRSIVSDMLFASFANRQGRIDVEFPVRQPPDMSLSLPHSNTTAARSVSNRAPSRLSGSAESVRNKNPDAQDTKNAGFLSARESSSLSLASSNASSGSPVTGGSQSHQKSQEFRRLRAASTFQSGIVFEDDNVVEPKYLQSKLDRLRGARKASTSRSSEELSFDGFDADPEFVEGSAGEEEDDSPESGGRSIQSTSTMNTVRIHSDSPPRISVSQPRTDTDDSAGSSQSDSSSLKNLKLPEMKIATASDLDLGSMVSSLSYDMDVPDSDSDLVDAPTFDRAVRHNGKLGADPRTYYPSDDVVDSRRIHRWHSVPRSDCEEKPSKQVSFLHGREGPSSSAARSQTPADAAAAASVSVSTLPLAPSPPPPPPHALLLKTGSMPASYSRSKYNPRIVDRPSDSMGIGCKPYVHRESWDEMFRRGSTGAPRSASGTPLGMEFPDRTMVPLRKHALQRRHIQPSAVMAMASASISSSQSDGFSNISPFVSLSNQPARKSSAMDLMDVQHSSQNMVQQTLPIMAARRKSIAATGEAAAFWQFAVVQEQTNFAIAADELADTFRQCAEKHNREFGPIGVPDVEFTPDLVARANVKSLMGLAGSSIDPGLSILRPASSAPLVT